MAEQNSADQDTAAGESDRRRPAEPEVSSPTLDHLQQTMDDARDAAKAALDDQPEV